MSDKYSSCCMHARHVISRDLARSSFNLAGEPIVESPADAIRTFLNADEGRSPHPLLTYTYALRPSVSRCVQYVYATDLSLLVLGGVLVRRRPFAATARPVRQSSCTSRTFADSEGRTRRVEVLRTNHTHSNI